MAPLFFHNEILHAGTDLALHEDTAKHVVQVLRMQEGDIIELTDGKGAHATASISRTQKRQCVVHVNDVHAHEQRHARLHMGVAFTKNSSRNEWILEKVTELGVATIVPLQTIRSEREKFRFDRWRNILVSAMLQSQQYYLPELRDLAPVEELAKEMKIVPQKLVAHCMKDVPRRPLSEALEKDKETLLLIGPEGDFTVDEVNYLTSEGFGGISMGKNRLRTETAAVTACAFFNMVNYD